MTTVSAQIQTGATAGCRILHRPPHRSDFWGIAARDVGLLVGELALGQLTRDHG